LAASTTAGSIAPQTLVARGFYRSDIARDSNLLSSHAGESWLSQKGIAIPAAITDIPSGSRVTVVY
jgi:hypothetical protein